MNDEGGDATVADAGPGAALVHAEISPGHRAVRTAAASCMYVLGGLIAVAAVVVGSMLISRTVCCSATSRPDAVPGVAVIVGGLLLAVLFFALGHLINQVAQLRLEASR